jgi:hypothetical protein
MPDLKSSVNELIAQQEHLLREFGAEVLDQDKDITLLNIITQFVKDYCDLLMDGLSIDVEPPDM